VKREQFRVASTFDVTLRLWVVAERDGQSTTHRSVQACVDFFKVHHARIRRALQKANPTVFDGLSLQFFKQDQAAGIVHSFLLGVGDREHQNLFSLCFSFN
jgi:hypothetical protein